MLLVHFANVVAMIQNAADVVAWFFYFFQKFIAEY
jgi:hypothetical protein